MSGRGGGQTPSPASEKWRVLASSDGLRCGLLGQSEVETATLEAGLGLATREGRHFILRSVEDAAAIGDRDARVLGVRETELEGRHLQFRDALSELSEIDWTKFPISGPRTTRWVCKFIRNQDIARKRWGSMRRTNQLWITSSVRGCFSAVVFDQLNVSELACMELTCRKMQMAVYRHRDRFLSGPGHDELQEDRTCTWERERLGACSRKPPHCWTT